MSEPKRYEIRTVVDMLAVPPDRRDLMLIDLGLFLALRDFMDATFKDLIAEGKAKSGDVFMWIDDGKHEGNIILKPMDETKVSR